MIDKACSFVLGARDPEMREIAEVLDAHKLAHAYAARGAMPVTARTAYDADGVVRLSRSGRGIPMVLASDRPLVFVECTMRHRQAQQRVDHHNPGDPGYDMPPERYLEGSSLGQILRLLDREPTPTQHLLAAADHCLTAAYQGECPGVDPNELLFLRASWRARMSGRTLGDVIEGILHAAAEVQRKYDSACGESIFADPTDVPRDLAEGGAYAGRPIRYRELYPGGELKEMLKGARPEHIERFMAEHRALGREVYGNPHRGYAGTYLPGYLLAATAQAHVGRERLQASCNCELRSTPPCG